MLILPPWSCIQPPPPHAALGLKMWSAQSRRVIVLGFTRKQVYEALSYGGPLLGSCACRGLWIMAFQ